eukprot:TRINITY_DN1331_c0_g1_i9.p1 TRINITY_DN1331_c0_g1~~TRINITY_DN1331_c0_g1_i9.p1  ORF type:complete len:356 (+),score=68.08 TRINITY_DN1331_c0_g1_i9:92-1159(+)
MFICIFFYFFFFNDTATTEIYTRSIVGSVRCVQETGINAEYMGYDRDFYDQFHIVIGGLDNVEARRWMNSMLHSLVEFDEDKKPIMSTVKPFIDGGSEGLQGQSRVIMPYISHCYECSMATMNQTKRYNICTLAETPRVPEHCIEYAYIKQWNDEMKKKFNKDSKDDMMWVYERAKKRADAYGIQGVTYMLTMGVIKNIIPAVATTNAIIAASCVNEAVKLGTFLSPHMDNEMLYIGQTGVYGYTYQYQRLEDCIVCQNKAMPITMSESQKLSDLISKLKSPPISLKNPSLRSNSASLYMTAPRSLEEELRPRLDMTFKMLKEEKLIEEKDSISVTDPILNQPLMLTFKLALQYT